MASSSGEGFWEALAEMLRVCPKDPTEEVQSHLNHLLERFKESFGSTMTDEKRLEHLEKCCSDTKTWYCEILTSFLQQNSEGPGPKHVSSFLEDKPLQCCLVVCCLEISSFINKLTLDFDPHLLRTFDLSAYNFWKVLALVIQTKVDLTLYVFEHLVKVEEMIVGILVWTSDSPLWDDIRANEGQMPSCRQVMSPKELEDPLRGELPEDDPLQGEEPSDQNDSTPNKPKRNNHLFVFSRKVYRLMHKRLTSLCSALNLHEELRLKIWTCFEYSLVHHFDMLRDRPLDWLLLCATHDLTKDTKRLPFKLIISCLKPKHMRKIESTLIGLSGKYQSDNSHGGRLLTPDTPSGRDQQASDVASFYCQVYTPVMAHFLKQFSPALGAGTPPLSPYPARPPASSRKYRWRPGWNIYVSQFNKDSPPQSPSSGLDYVFHSSPSQHLTRINTMVGSRGTRPKRALTFIGDEGDNEEEAGPSVKMPHMSCPPAMFRRLRDVECDRRQNRETDKPGTTTKHFYI